MVSLQRMIIVNLKITNDKNDDYGTMREVIYRRYFRVLKRWTSKT